MKQHQKIPWLQRKLENIWYQNSIGKYPLIPLSALFCQLAKRRRKQQEKHQQDLNIPVIVVGNISIGGTGKTPLVIRLTELLQTQGYKPAIITRGYKGTADQWPLAVDTNTDVILCGDEAKLMALRTGVPVIAGAEREADIKYALEHTDCNIIISDDGLQHYRMKRDMEIVVIDAKRRFGNGHCLPAGPLREKPERLTECDFVITNGEPCQENEHVMHVSGTRLISLDNTQRKNLGDFDSVEIVTGIGNPQRFIDTLEKSGLSIKQQHIFPDHHTFSSTDFKVGGKRSPIVMTEKDAVKCMQFGLKNTWYLEVNAELDQIFEDVFLEKVTRIS